MAVALAEAIISSTNTEDSVNLVSILLCSNLLFPSTVGALDH